MVKRALGIPHIDGASMSRRARWAAQGVQVPAAPRPNEAANADAPQRRDAPKLRVGVQARSRKGCRPSDFITDIAEAKRDYEDDKYAASAKDSRAAVANTWQEYHAKAHRLDPVSVPPSPFPVTVEGLKSVAALMKLDGYRSFSNYASWAKGHHIEQGYDWTQQLAHELTQAGRSLGRGLGPPRQSAAFDLQRVACSPSVPAPSSQGGPIFPKETILLGSLWVLREIEIAWTSWGDIVVDVEGMLIYWTLTACKTDPGAKSCTRKWGCLCNELGEAVCPYHLMVRYRKMISEYFGTESNCLADDRPAFPDVTGKVVQKAAMVEALERTLRTIGEATRDQAGRRRFGGHSCRVAGSRFWASHGMEVYKLQIFARWGSDVILRYVADSPLHHVRLPASTYSSSSSSCAVVEQGGAIEDVNAKVDKLARFVQDAVVEMQALKADLDRVRSEPSYDFVRNNATRCWHEVLLGGASIQPASWKTRCGWRFGFVDHRRGSAVPPAGVRCDKCFRHERPGARRSSSSSSPGS